MEIVTEWKEIPLFDDENEEAEYWSEHQLDARLMNSSIHQVMNSLFHEVLMTDHCIIHLTN